MIRPNTDEKRFVCVSYEPETGISEKLMTAVEEAALDVAPFDHVLATARGTYGFRTADGKMIERPLLRSGIGDTALDIIRALQVNPGIVQTRTDIAFLINNEEYCGDWPLPARMRIIRKSHRESGSNQRMFLSGPDGGYFWPRDLSWCWIDRIPPAATTKAN